MPRLSPKGPSNVVAKGVLASALDEDLIEENVICERFARKQDQQNEGEYVVSTALECPKDLLDDVVVKVFYESLVENVFEDVAVDHVLKEGHAEDVIAEVLDNETLAEDVVTKVLEEKVLLELVVSLLLGEHLDEGVVDEVVVESMLVEEFAEYVLIEVVATALVMKNVGLKVVVEIGRVLARVIFEIVLKEVGQKVDNGCDIKLAEKVDVPEVDRGVEDAILDIDREVDVIGLEVVPESCLVDVLQKVVRETCVDETCPNKESIHEGGLIHEVLVDTVNVVLEGVLEQGLDSTVLNEEQHDHVDADMSEVSENKFEYPKDNGVEHVAIAVGRNQHEEIEVAIGIPGSGRCCNGCI